MSKPIRTPQFWLAELDQWGNPTLIDGSHEDAAGANEAAYLIRSIGLGNANRRFAVAKVELSECAPSDEGVDQEAVAICRDMVNNARRKVATNAD